VFYSLIRLRLPLSTRADDASGPAFDVLADRIDRQGPRVMTGHDNGVITLGLAEALRQLGEPAHHVGQLFISISESIACSPVDSDGVLFWPIVRLFEQERYGFAVPSHTQAKRPLVG
jgi:Putative zinc-binding metallo-peptidase